jgi:choline transport protein
MADAIDDKKSQMDDNLNPVSSIDEGAIQQLKKGQTPDDVDDAILRLNGHEAVLERRFSWISAFGLAFSITNSWVGYLVSSL